MLNVKNLKDDNNLNLNLNNMTNYNITEELIKTLDTVDMLDSYTSNGLNDNKLDKNKSNKNKSNKNKSDIMLCLYYVDWCSYC
jgi:hypothetical protein